MISSEMCYTYGFNEKFFKDGFTDEAYFGLYINSRRCRAFETASAFKIDKWSRIGFGIDEDTLDALCVTGLETEKDKVMSKWQKIAERAQPSLRDLL
jgi:hypothetical protein